MRIRIFSLYITISTRKWLVGEHPRFGFRAIRCALDSESINTLYLGPIYIGVDWLPPLESVDWWDDEDPMQQPAN